MEEEKSPSAKDDQQYEVEKIVGEKIENGVRLFLVKWKGWSGIHDYLNLFRNFFVYPIFVSK